MTKATIIIDIHDVSILLSGVMLLEQEILNFQKMNELDRLEHTGDLPSDEELKESLVLCIEKKKMLEDIMNALQVEELKSENPELS